MKRVLLALALFASVATVAIAQQPQAQAAPPKTLAEANLVIAQDHQQIAEMELRIEELEAAFTSQLNAQRQQLAGGVRAAQETVLKEQQEAAAAEAAKKAEAEAAKKAPANPQKH